MKLTRASSYALHAVTFMAAQKHDRPVASHNIAHARGIPERFLLKVLKPLVSAGVLHSVKGPGGGYLLARPGSEVSLLDVVEAVEGPVRGLAPLVNGGRAGGGLGRRLESLCEDAAALVREELGRAHFSDLIG